ncbi:MAG: ribonuclease R [Parcubacteria group bacterium GW2011_GWA1_47_8]|nr:MAG: ribonuclease R [Parcubacteria group bacterium GW2011_GWA1_47_8]KKW07789.1 MAG: ribonuclease R [Parcubacteria group bacterium GW2011_GWA2_49_16]
MGNKNYIEGIITTTGKGLGFVSLGEGSPRENDIRIETGFLNTALHRDRVKVLLHPRIPNEQQTGEITEIIERAKITFVGTLEKDTDAYFLVPQDNHIYVDIRIPAAGVPAGSDKKKALVRITKWTDPKKNPEGELVEIIGDSGDNETEIRAIILDKGLQMELPDAIEKEAHEIKKDATALLVREIHKRRDFRNITTFTIDPADAKDFDDALSVQTLADGSIEIGVHIADVSAYIRPHSAIDEEARNRATSIYLVDRVVPMFPEVLSNDLCSLNEKEDKLTFSAVFTFPKEAFSDPKKSVYPETEWFGRTVIHSDRRFAYEDAQKILDDGAGMFHDELVILNTLAKKLDKQNRDAGAINFSHDEVKFILDENKRPIGVYRKEMQDTNKLIEEFMLLANRKVAEFVAKKIKDDDASLFVYRIHDEPEPDRLGLLATFLGRIGYKLPLKDGRATSQDINKLLDQIKGTPQESMLHTVIIRTLAKAIYSTNNIGHYGLGFKYYTHFTSPIRRYPDVMVHRLLAHYLAGEQVTQEEMQEYRKLSAHSSEMEKLAADAERASIKFKQAEYMATRIGQTFEGTISGVAEWGIFIEENETKCEGLVRIADLGNDFYIFEKENYRIIGKNTRKRYALGDKVRIRVKAVDLERKSIDYEFVEK